jgi:hypothetical protein
VQGTATIEEPKKTQGSNGNGWKWIWQRMAALQGQVCFASATPTTRVFVFFLFSCRFVV